VIASPKKEGDQVAAVNGTRKYLNAKRYRFSRLPGIIRANEAYCFQIDNYMDVYFNCIYCGKALATNVYNAGAKTNCPDCGKLLFLPLANYECKCQHCAKPMFTIHSMLGTKIQCLQCKKKTLLVNCNHSDFAPVPAEIENIHLADLTYKPPKKVPIKRSTNKSYSNYAKLPSYIYINVFFALGLAITRIFFHNTTLERVFIYSVQISIGATCILEAYLFYVIQCINKKGINENIIESQQFKDVLSWKRFYSSPINAILWNFIIFLPLLIFFAIDFKWFVVILLIIYQAYKSLIVFHIQEINVEVIKYRKNQTMENIKKETGVQSFIDEKDGETVET